MQNLTMSELRGEFPLIVNHPELSYLDSAASSQKPKAVLDRLQKYYASENANVHRGLYRLSEQATADYENARKKGQNFLGATSEREVIFTKGCTEGINLVASCLAENYLKSGDEILLTECEHHSNIVPWQIAAKRSGAKVRFIPLGNDLRLDMGAAEKLFNDKTKVFACGHISNVLGVIHPISKLLRMAKSYEALTLIDGAQGAVHLNINVNDLGCDFYVVSGHKMFGPTGISLLYGKEKVLDSLPPYQGGGDMIETVSLEGSTWADLPAKYEAGTPNIAGAIGLGTAIDFFGRFDRRAALEHEVDLGRKAIAYLKDEVKARVFVPEDATVDDWTGIVTFALPDIHPHDIATICGEEQVCMRAGHHCAQPLMKVLGVPATARISPFVYNNTADIDRFINSIEKVRMLFGS